MKQIRTRGFTLIELLVVIAIIGILSSVVLASLNQARGKGANAAVKSNLANIRAQAELFYDNNSLVYTNLCSDTTVTRARTAAGAAGGGTAYCSATATAWAAASPLKVAETGAIIWWCVDSTGASKGHTAAISTGTACP